MRAIVDFIGEDFSLWQMIGPLFILCAFALSPQDPLLLSVGIGGLFLSACWQIRGFSYALILLGIVAIAEHAFLSERHFWLLGLEGSYAIAFFITALSSEDRTSFVQSLSAKLEASGASIRNLEDEFASLREASTAERIVLQEKIGTLQKEIEEIQSEQSSLLILNEVLRKTAARECLERDEAKESLVDAERCLAQRFLELEGIQKELAHLTDSNALVLENREVRGEINAARVDREQARLISETLSRLHAKECLKAKEGEARIAFLEEENGKLKKDFSFLQVEAETLTGHLEEIGRERERQQLALQQFEAIQTDRNYLKERVEKAEVELEQRRENPVHPEELLYLQEKVASLSEIEALYKQLRTQFEEKNSILHKTRVQLFRADTELETLKMEKEQRELLINPIPEEMRREFSALEEELDSLEKENEELEDLVSTLTENPIDSPSRRKKKVKMDPDQKFLF
jgi:DNA repair exonuclease SbcCD ATPase subunit